MTVQSPRHIALFSGKGGVGKTTLALALAQYAGRTLIDSDPQCSALDWADMRETREPLVVPAPLARLPKTLDDYPATIVDMPGSLTAGSHAGLSAVDLVLLVTGDRQLELNALGQSIDIARAAGPRVVVLLNRLHPFTDATGVRTAIEGLEVEVCPVVIRERSAHYKSLTQGLTAVEYEPEGAAATEIAQLWTWLEAQG